MPSVIAAAATKKRLKNYLCAVAVLRDMALATWSPPFSNCPQISLASPSLMPVCLAFVVFVRSFYRTNICILMCTCVIMFVLGVGFPDTDENLEYDQILRKVRPLFNSISCHQISIFIQLVNVSLFRNVSTTPSWKRMRWIACLNSRSSTLNSPLQSQFINVFHRNRIRFHFILIISFDL